MTKNIVCKDEEIANFLRAKIEDGGIAAEVAREALEQDDYEAFFSDLSRFGCITGMVGFLCWYSDTHAFFDRHYHEIEELREEMEGQGVPISLAGRDLKNTLAWFGFEEVAYRMMEEMGLA